MSPTHPPPSVPFVPPSHRPFRPVTMSAFPTAHSTVVSNPRLRLLNKLKAGEYPLMTFMAIPSVRHAQIVSLTGLDVSRSPSFAPVERELTYALCLHLCQAVIIDGEHGHIGDDQMHNSVAAVSGQGVSPIIRVRGTSADILKRAIDTGAQFVPYSLLRPKNRVLTESLSFSCISGIMIPQINNAAEAEQVVRYSKFPPQGLRGQGSAFPAIAHGLTTPEYMLSANQTLLTMVQIETRAGVENVEEICAVDGVGAYSLFCRLLETPS